MHVSVVINTYNRAATLAATLDALQRQCFTRFEVVVVNGPSSDGTDALLARWASDLRVVRCPERHLARSRNLGTDAASGEVVAFIDDDALPEPTWLEDLVAAYADPAVAGAGGVVLDETGVTPQYRFSACDRVARPDFDVEPPFEQLTQPGADPFLYLQGTNMSFRREALASIGGFDEEIEYNYDEADLCLRLIDAGHRLVALDGARVHHKLAPSHLRRARGVSLDPFFDVKNRAYFAVRHGRATRSLAEVLASLERHLEHLRATAREQSLAGRLSGAELERFLQRLVTGLEAGVVRGLAGDTQGRPIAPADAGSFLRYRVLAPAGRRLRACFVALEYPPPRGGGIARFTQDLAGAMAGQGHEVHVVTQDAGLHRVTLEDGVWVHHHPAGDRFVPELDGVAAGAAIERIASSYRAVAEVHERAPVDVVSAPLWAGDALLCAHDRRWPTVVTCMTPMRIVAGTQPAVAARPESPLQVDLEDAATAAATRLHAISRAILDELRETVPAAAGVPADVLPLGTPDRREHYPRRRADGDGLVEILFAGRLEPRKGVDVLLEAGEGLVRELPHVRLTLLGADTGFAVEGGEPYAERFARAAPDVAEQVRFAGEVPEAELFQAYADCDVFCAPSRYDSFGLVLLEAMSFGRPVVAGRTGGMGEVVADGETGLLVDPDDAAALQEALRTLAGNEGLRERMGTAGRARYEAHFTAEAAASRTAAAYAAVAEAHAPAADASAVPTVAAELLERAGGINATAAARAVTRLLEPVAFPADYEAGLRRAAGYPEDDHFVRGLYDTLVGRAPEADALAFTLGQLRDGRPRIDVIRAVARSDEARARGVDADVAERLRGIDPAETVAAVRGIWTLDDDAFLDRLPVVLGIVGPAEPLRAAVRAALPRGRRVALKEALEREETTPELAPATRAALRDADLHVRPELEAELGRLAALPPDGLIDGIYTMLLGRTADPVGMAANRALLDGGVVPAEIVRTVAASDEAARRGVETAWLEGLESRVPALAQPRGKPARRRGEALRSRLPRRHRDTELTARLRGLEEQLERLGAEHASASAALRADIAQAATSPRVFGPGDRLTIAPTAQVHDALFNTVSGRVTVGDHAFFGHGVAVLTGTHDVKRRGADRQTAVPDSGRDVEIGDGAWVASRSTVLGPCRIGADAVVAAGAVVTGDVPAGAVVAGVPARVVRRLGPG